MRTLSGTSSLTGYNAALRVKLGLARTAGGGIALALSCNPPKGSQSRPEQDSSAAPVTPELQQEIEQFLYRESRILDDRRYEEWYALLADDLHYFMPTRYNRLKREADKETEEAEE